MRFYYQQQQARQLRSLERAAAKESGQPLRPLTFTEKYVLGVRDPKPRRPLKQSWLDRALESGQAERTKKAWAKEYRRREKAARKRAKKGV